MSPASPQASSAEEGAAARLPQLVETWPAGVSTRASMRISDVLAALRPEFPALTSSKLRFLEDQGLVEPVRTPAGYRQYSPAHVERLRFVLGQQRDHYLPLKVIKDRLAEMDAGLYDPAPVVPHLATTYGERADLRPADRLTAATLAAEAGVEVRVVEELLEAGIIRSDARGRFDSWAQQIVVHAAALHQHGIGARHLRALRSSADRQLALAEQVVAPVRSQGTPAARARADATAVELGESFIQLHAALVRQALSRQD